MPRSRPASNPISFHKHTKQYYVTRTGKRIYLGSDKEEALKKYQKALDYRLTEKPISHIDIARLYQGMGECHRIDGNSEEAIVAYLKGYAHRKEVENLGVVESMMSIVSMIY